MIALECEIDDGTGTEPVFADVFAERGGVELNFPRLRWKLGRAQFRGRSVAVLVEDKSVHHAVGIALEAYAESDNLVEELGGRRRENRDRNLSGCLHEKYVVNAKRLEQEFVGKFVGSHIIIEHRTGYDWCQRRVRIERGETQIVEVRDPVGEDDDGPPRFGGET